LNQRIALNNPGPELRQISRVRHFLTWLMVFGILAGLNARVLAANESVHAVHSHEHHDCSGHSDDGDSHHHDDKCPLDHHHHCGSCIHSLPLSMENDVVHRLNLPPSSRSAIRHESELPPDGPSLALDKPPLI
jgi:hypothetical protein